LLFLFVYDKDGKGFLGIEEECGRDGEEEDQRK